MNPQAKIYVTDHCGMVRSAIVRTLQQQGPTNIVTATPTGYDAQTKYFNVRL